MKKPSGKADLDIFSYIVVVSGLCRSVAIAITFVNKRD